MRPLRPARTSTGGYASSEYYRGLREGRRGTGAYGEYGGKPGYKQSYGNGYRRGSRERREGSR